MEESETSQLKPKLQVTMAAYMLDVLSLHQRNIILLLFSRELEDYIEYFLIWTQIPTLAQNHCISLHATVKIDYYLSLNSLQVSPNYQIRGSVWVSYSALKTRYYFERISNGISFVNSFPLFTPTLSFESKIRNQHCVTIVTQIAAG